MLLKDMVMKINLADYPPDCGKTLILKRRYFFKVGFLIMFLGALLISGSFLIYIWGHFYFFFLVDLYIFLVSLFFIYLGFLDCSDPMKGAISVDQSGLIIYPILGAPKLTTWNQINQIKLRSLFGFPHLGIRTVKRTYYFPMASHPVNIKEFAELMKQWHQFYNAASSASESKAN